MTSQRASRVARSAVFPPTWAILKVQLLVNIRRPQVAGSWAAVIMSRGSGL